MQKRVALAGLATIGVAIVVLVTLVATGVFGTDAGSDGAAASSDLEAARDVCVGRVEEVLEGNEAAQEPAEYVRLADDAKSVSVQTTGGDEFESILTFMATACVLGELDAPSSITTKMEGTTALMGRQVDEWDHYEVTWSYHPDSGMTAIIEGVS